MYCLSLIHIFGGVFRSRSFKLCLGILYLSLGVIYLAFGGGKLAVCAVLGIVILFFGIRDLGGSVAFYRFKSYIAAFLAEIVKLLFGVVNELKIFVGKGVKLCRTGKAQEYIRVRLERIAFGIQMCIRDSRRNTRVL